MDLEKLYLVNLGNCGLVLGLIQHVYFPICLNMIIASRMGKSDSKRAISLR